MQLRATDDVHDTFPAACGAFRGEGLDIGGATIAFLLGLHIKFSFLFHFPLSVRNVTRRLCELTIECKSKIAL